MGRRKGGLSFYRKKKEDQQYGDTGNCGVVFYRFYGGFNSYGSRAFYRYADECDRSFHGAWTVQWPGDSDQSLYL